MSTLKKGHEAEEKASAFLTQHGFLIVERNYYAKKLGEIDIIATKDQVYHFIEVKSASSYEAALQNITPAKLSKLKRSIAYYLQHHKLDVNHCLDALIISDEGCEFLENITL